MNIKTYYLAIVLLLCSCMLFKWMGLTCVLVAWGFQISHLFCTWKDTQRAKYSGVKERMKRKYYSNSGVSILKPLNGTLPTLEENLKSYFLLEYPLFELIVCVAKKNDPALEIVNKLQKEFPDVSVLVSIGTEECGMNPKLRNLATGYKQTKYNLIWIADANIVASDCAMQDMVDKCVDGARLVHQIPWGVSGPGVEESTGSLSPGSMLVRWYFATAHGRPYTVINNLFCSCVNGMSNMISKPHLEKIGGLAVFADHLAEDSHMGVAFDKQGYEVTMSKYTGLQNLGAFDISNYIERRVRWARLRMQTGITSRATPFELVIDSHLFSWLCLISLSCSHGQISTTLAMLHPFAWFMVDAITFLLLDRAVGLPKKWQDNAGNNYFFDWGRISDKPRGIYFFIINMVQHYVLWIFREFIGVYIRFKALQNINTVKWGDSDYKINKKE
jgi:ceramide glucosyltransferase